MIVSDRPNRSNSRWLRAWVLLGALIVLPLGLASAQDYIAVAQRLKESVRQGEITAQQADAMMAALDVKTSPAPSDAKLDAAAKKLKAMVESGELTKEQASAKMAARFSRMGSLPRSDRSRAREKAV